MQKGDLKLCLPVLSEDAWLQVRIDKLTRFSALCTALLTLGLASDLRGGMPNAPRGCIITPTLGEWPRSLVKLAAIRAFFKLTIPCLRRYCKGVMGYDVPTPQPRSEHD